MDPVEFLEWEELLVLHADELRAYGGQDGFIDEGVARSVMSRAQFTAQYTEDADLADLAADYMYDFATTQGFMDGNKRTAVVSALFFLRKNGWNLVINSKVLYLVAHNVVRKELDREELAEIIRDHMISLGDEPPG